MLGQLHSVCGIWCNAHGSGTSASFAALVLAIVGYATAATKITLLFALNTLFSLRMLRAVGRVRDASGPNAMLLAAALAGAAAVALRGGVGRSAEALPRR